MKVLCVIDMQKDFVDGSLGTGEAGSIVPNVIRKMEEYYRSGTDTAVILTMDTHDESYMSTEEGKNLPVKHCIKPTGGWELCKGVDDMAKEILGDHEANCPLAIVEKETFGSINLPEYINKAAGKNNGAIEEIELIGLCTDVCVISNALLLKANYPSIPIYVDAACCAGVTPESHDTALAAMESCQIHIRNKEKEPWR